METSEPLLDVRDLAVHFPIKRGVVLDRTVGHVYAVDGVSLHIGRGETYGLVGESGCGKSTLGRAILRLVDLTAGQVTFDGVDVAHLRGEQLRRMRRRFQMVFQDPMSSLNPRQSVESLLTEGMKAHGLSRGPAADGARLRELVDSVGLPAGALRRYPHEFSGGQRQRIGIARALCVEPDLIVADEPVSALDVSVQAQVLNLLGRLQAELGLTYLVIAHDLAVVRHVSDRVGVMYLGGLVEEAPSAGALRRSAASVHAGSALCGAGAGSRVGGPPGAHPAHRRPALARRAPQRMPLPHALPVAPADAVRRRAAPAARDRRSTRRAPGRLPLRGGHPQWTTPDAPRRRRGGRRRPRPGRGAGPARLGYGDPGSLSGAALPDCSASSDSRALARRASSAPRMNAAGTPIATPSSGSPVAFPPT